jgi:pimeloyl-ACP methyl ester carboxylesterase
VDSCLPELPPARVVELPGRGRTWIYDSGPLHPRGPDDDETPTQTLLLLHGWTSTAALNWFRCFPELTSRYRVVAPDHRGHGKGIRSRTLFRLEDCADDAAALIEELRLEPVTAVGYSMGGPIAQLLWRRHPDAVRGLVLCATAASFASRAEFNGALATLSLGASVALSIMPPVVRRQGMQWATRNWIANAESAAWAIEEWRRHEPASLIQAGLALSRFDSRGWIGEIDVPTAVVVTALDSVVLPHRQWHLATCIPRVMAFPVQAEHRACVDSAELFVPALLSACEHVGKHIGFTDKGCTEASGISDPTA